MVASSEIRAGMIILLNGEPTLVLSHQISKHGRAGAHNKCKLRGLKTGSSVVKDFTGESVEDVVVSARNLQYLYEDGGKAVFMDPQTFDQTEIKIENIPGERRYLKEGIVYIGKFYEGEVISVELPKKIAFEVAEAPTGAKGDTATNALKEVILENGETFKTPLFIKKGDVILINTDTEEYAGKE